jgi:hypothetical protein
MRHPNKADDRNGKKNGDRDGGPPPDSELILP